MRRLLLLSLLGLSVQARAEVSHELFDGLLHDHVRDGRVDYEAIAKDARLGQYLTLLAEVKIAELESPRQQLALYINAYNAFTIQGVLDNWPLKKVVMVDGFFNQKTYTLGGQPITLDALEQERVRKFGDARIHAALVCGARSCPPLRNEAYLAERLDQQLEEQARAWVNDSSKNRIDRAGKKLLVSKIFEWYAKDFERMGGPAGFVKKYLTADEDRAWIGGGGYQVDYLPYDWALNGK